MRSVIPMWTAKTGYIIMSALFCGMGAALLLSPQISAVWIGRLLGIFMMIFGSVKLIGYFSRDLFRLAFQYDLAFGLLLIALGIVTLRRPNATLNFLAMISGIPVLADGFFKIQIALDAQRFGIRRWWLILVLSALTCGIGIILLLCPAAGVTAVTALMGASLLLDGILNLSVALCTVKIIAHQQPDSPDDHNWTI